MTTVSVICLPGVGDTERSRRRPTSSGASSMATTAAIAARVVLIPIMVLAIVLVQWLVGSRKLRSA